MKVHSASDQSLAHLTAWFQPLMCSCLSASPICGTNLLSRDQFSLRSSSPSQNPTVSPAMYAAPRAVDSMHLGRSTSMPVMSARNWQRKLLALAPPSTLTEWISVLESASIALMTSLA